MTPTQQSLYSIDLPTYLFKMFHDGVELHSHMGEILYSGGRLKHAFCGLGNHLIDFLNGVLLSVALCSSAAVAIDAATPELDDASSTVFPKASPKELAKEVASPAAATERPTSSLLIRAEF